MSTTPSNPMALPPGFDLANPAAFGMGPAAQTTDDGAGLNDVLRVLKQRKLTIFITFIVLSTLVVGGTFLIRLYFPLYTSSGILELEPPRDNPMDTEPRQLAPDQMKQALQTEARKFRQPNLLQEVLQLPEVKATSFYKYYNDDIPEAVTDMDRYISSAPIPDTNLIRVSVSCRDASEAELIVNSLIRRYMNKYVEQARNQVQAELTGLKNTLAALEERLSQKRTEISTHRHTANTPAMELERNVVADVLNDINQQITLLEASRISLESQLDSIRNVPQNELPINAEERIMIESDPILRYHRAQVEALDVSIRSMLELVGPKHRQMAYILRTREGWQMKELAKREELITDIRQRRLESIRQELANIQNVVSRFRSRAEEINAEQRELDRGILRFHELRNDEDMIRKEIEGILPRIAQAEHAERGQQRARRLSIVQLGVKPVKPARPDYAIYIGGGLAFAVLGSIGVAFLREFTDKAIRTPLDIVRHGHLSVLGNIPLIDDEQADVDSIEHAARLAPHSLVAEAFRRVRTTLQFSGPAERQRSLLITSAGPGDGKTAVAINLAVTLANGGQRVLLVDCNFRRPGLREAFKSTRREGLSNLLVGQGKLDDFVTRTEQPNLFILSSGPMPPTPAELLGSTYMQNLLKDALTSYDRVIFDGPPALLISDALILAAQVDGVILVARAVSNSKGAVKRAREQLERIGAHVLGAVLNGVQAAAGGYFRRQYQDFYEYAADETAGPPELPEPGDDNPTGLPRS